MKQITFLGGTVVTGTAVAKALLNYLPELTRAGESRAVQIPVREADGSISDHWLMLTPTTALDVADYGGTVPNEEIGPFAVPHFPAVGRVARTEVSEAAKSRARDLDRAITEIEQLNSP